MPKLTKEKIAELRALCEKATPGEYKVATWRAGESVSVAIVAGVDEGDEYIVAEMMAEDDQAEIDARQLVAARTALPDLLSDLEEARRERDQYSLMFQNSDQHAKQLQQAYTDAISGRKAYCHLCHQFFEGHPDGHGLGECVAVCGSCFINATKKDDELCDSCKRAESAERALAEARQGWIRVKLDKNFQAISDNLPEVEQEVLIAHFASTPHWHAIATFNKKRRFHDGNDGDDYGGVDHWRPLPAPPEPTKEQS